MRCLLSTATFLCLFAARTLTAASACTADEHKAKHQPAVAESREQRLPAVADTTIDPGVNGGIRIHGWDRDDVLVRACIHASAPTDSEAQALLKQVKIVRGPGDLEPDGPAESDSTQWDVSYEVWMPSRSNLQAHCVNGGITLESLEGNIRFRTQNGGVNLISLAGDVKGSTQNGGLTVQLNGSSWRGAGLQAQTENGGLNVALPDGYSAPIEASTVNGGMHVNFPVQLSGKDLRFNLGSGGSPVRLKTTNGGVHITKS